MWLQPRHIRHIQKLIMKKTCYIMFGKESAGIPEEILVDNEDTCQIPMMGM